MVSTDCSKLELHVEDDRWPLKIRGQNTTAKAKTFAVQFALAFADNVRMSAMAGALAA